MPLWTVLATAPRLLVAAGSALAGALLAIRLAARTSARAPAAADAASLRARDAAPVEDRVEPAPPPRAAHAEDAGRASFLAEASRILAASLDADATLKSMARVAVPYLADWVVVDVVDAGRRLRRVGVAHARPELEAPLAHALREVIEPETDGALAHVLARGEPTLVRDVNDAWLATRARDARHLAAGSLRPRSLLLVPLRARGRTLGVVSFARTTPRQPYALADLALAEDLAQRAALAADNARLYRAARDASRAKDEFLALLSHELRTPLTPVLGWVRMLRTGTLPPDVADRALETVERNTRLQLRLIEDLLDVSSIVTGRLRLDLRLVTPAEVLAAAADAVAEAAAEKAITLARTVARDVPMIRADATRLRQALTHLLANAVKFTPAGGHVSASVVVWGDEVRITVTDTGQGFPPDVALQIFERFRQADSTITRRYGGLGLGLAIVRHVVELHGGTVDAWSDGVGRGSTFAVALPVAGPPASPDDTTPAASTSLGAGADRGGPVPAR